MTNKYKQLDKVKVKKLNLVGTVIDTNMSDCLVEIADDDGRDVYSFWVIERDLELYSATKA